MGLVFFMTVENTSGTTCILPEETLEFVKKFNLQTVKREELGVFSQWGEFSEAIIKVYEKVGSAPIYEEEEGSVLYFILRDKHKRNNDKVLSLCKLKTFE